MPAINKNDLSKQVGITQQPSDWITIDQDKINLFAEATNDFQFIHVDPVKAKQSPFGQTIAHGFLSLSMLTHLSDEGGGIVVENNVMGINYGFDKVRFIAPVKSGSRIRGHFKLLEYSEKKQNRFLLRTEVNVEIDGEDKPALLAEWLTMFVVK